MSHHDLPDLGSLLYCDEGACTNLNYCSSGTSREDHEFSARRYGWVVHPDGSNRCPVHARTLKPCGTNAAWMRHRRAGEKPCEPCRNANNEYQRQGLSARKRARQGDQS